MNLMQTISIPDIHSYVTAFTPKKGICIDIMFTNTALYDTDVLFIYLFDFNLLSNAKKKSACGPCIVNLMSLVMENDDSQWNVLGLTWDACMFWGHNKSSTESQLKPEQDWCFPMQLAPGQHMAEPYGLPLLHLISKYCGKTLLQQSCGYKHLPAAARSVHTGWD